MDVGASPVGVIALRAAEGYLQITQATGHAPESEE